ncbi:MAG: ABC transporter ATP-binding protein [Armatimonadetes bacterium]|nr:ABC transporter ATP-binding protein [Armatimonadota bacterium]
MPPAIETRNLTKVYRSGRFSRPVKALDSLNLRVEPGEIFGFLGANGAGKTTTIKLLLRLSFPTSGEAYLLGHKIPHTASRARIGYLPENPYFYDYATPEELLNLYADIFGMPKDLRERRIGETLERVRMTQWRKTPLRNFSKGMVQRVGVAQALLNDPDLLLLDEPTSGLDPVGRAEMRDLIQDLREQGKTVFLNSHLLSEIENICDRVAILRRGELARQGTLNELLSVFGYEVVADHAPEPLAEKLRDRGLETLHANGRMTVLLKDPGDIRPVVEQVFAHNATLLKVAPQRERLEDLFLTVEGEGETRLESGPGSANEEGP